MSITAYIALGSNLGDRKAHLDRALQALRDHPGITVSKVSSYHETAPVGGPAGQGKYLNAAAELLVDESIRVSHLLNILLNVEADLGRVRKERFGPRTIDLDLLLFGDRAWRCPGLEVPHPRMHQRRFVLEPLAEIAPDVVHPATGATIRELLDRFSAQGEQQTGNRTGRQLEGLKALVTGSTSGIGRAIVLELAEAGADVVIHGRRAGPASELAEEVSRRFGVKAETFLLDLAQSDALATLITGIWRSCGALDIWINNAGADILTGEAASWPFERKLQALWAVDVTATMLLSRDVGARMKKRGSGVIVNIGWDQAETGMEGDSGQLFGATKAAVMAFTKSLAVTLAPEVRVNCVAPGWIRTKWGEGASEHWQERVKRETPLGRWGTPADVAAAVRWLVSPAASHITGQIIRVNGGAVR